MPGRSLVVAVLMLSLGVASLHAASPPTSQLRQRVEEGASACAAATAPWSACVRACCHFARFSGFDGSAWSACAYWRSADFQSPTAAA